MKTLKPIVGKILYAVLFLVVVPLTLILWAIHTEDIIRFEIGFPPYIGLIIGIIGLFIMGWGMLALAVYVKGLPMNAYPPVHYVKKGPYRIFEHPIYWGFGFFVIGMAIYFNSPSGLWLIAPITIVGMMALVWGYERQSLRELFPNEFL